MPRRRYLFDPPERFVAGTVGEPGDRTFFLQARDGAAGRQRRPREGPGRASSPSGSASCSPSSSGAASRGAAAADARRSAPTTRAPLDEPLNEAFRAGSLTLGWDGDAERVLVEARAQSEDGEADRPGRGRRRGRGRPRPAARPDQPPTRRGRSWPARPGSSRPAGRRARCAARRSTRRATSARGATATTSTSGGRRVLDRGTTLDVLARGRDRDRRPDRRLVEQRDARAR